MSLPGLAGLHSVNEPGHTHIQKRTGDASSGSWSTAMLEAMAHDA